MAQRQTPCLYRETRLNLDPAYPGSTIAITLPSHGTLRNHAGARSVVHENHVDLDENQFAKTQLATDGSIFFRSAEAYPRTFLWRILDDRRVLELQSVDLSQEPKRDNKDEAQLTIRLRFPAPIRPFGVAFAQPEDRDALNAFVITQSKELWTLNLRRKAWMSEQGTDHDVDEWCKAYRPSTWVARTPYRLVAVNAQCLVVSVDNGSLVRLERGSNDSGAVWRETVYTEGRWGTLRGLVSWKGSTVRMGNEEWASSSAAAIAHSPIGSNLITVTLDHVLKFWNLQTGKVGLQTDLLGDNDRDPKAQAVTVNPAQAQLMQVVQVEGAQDGDLYYVVTYSPLKHQFKFWAILDPDAPMHGIRDVQAEIDFIPPFDDIMDTNLWNMEEFHVKPGKGWRQSELWIRARVGSNSMVYMLTFDLMDLASELQKTWKDDWISVDAGSVTVEALKRSHGQPAEPDPFNPYMHEPTASEQWLDYLFHPGRFTTPTLETALHVYRRGSGQTPTARKGTASSAKATDFKSLKERICFVVTSRINMQRATDDTLDYNQYELDGGAQWQIFHGLVRDLHKRRSEALSFAFDADDNLPWMVRADCVCAIRKCSELEILTLNEGILTSQQPNANGPLSRTLQDKDSIRVARLLCAANKFRRTFGQAFQHTLKMAVRAETLQEPSHSINDRIVAFDSRCDLSDQVTDDDLSQLDALHELGGFKKLDGTLFEAALKRLDEHQRGDNRSAALLTRFGARTLIRGAQEILNMGTSILLELLVLVVFTIGELESNDEQCKFNKASLFDTLIIRLRDHGLLTWLASTAYHERSAGLEEHDADTMRVMPSTAIEDGSISSSTSVLTMLESIFIGDWATMKFPTQSKPPLSSLITYWCRAWTFRASLTQKYESVASHVMGNLLCKGEYELASSFSSFVPSSPWGTYQKARLCLALGEFAESAQLFRKSAFGLSMGHFDVSQSDYAELLDIAERDYFSAGLCRFYQHVISLFEKARVYSYVADFSKLALLALAATTPDEDTESVSTDVLSRLFNASIRTSQFEDAYAAVARYTNPALRHLALRTLITSLATSHPPSTSLLLTRLPFATLFSQVDSVLSSLCTNPLTRSTTITPSFPPSSHTSSIRTTNTTTTSTLTYHNLLYAFRVSRNDFRGAAAVLYDRLQRIKQRQSHSSSSTTTSRGVGGTSYSEYEDNDDEERISAYLLLINALSCVEKEQAWIVADKPLETPSSAPSQPQSQSQSQSKSQPQSLMHQAIHTMSGGLLNSGSGGGGGGGGRASQVSNGVGASGAVGGGKRTKRGIVTLEEVRREYQEELDRMASIESGRFAFDDGSAAAAGSGGMGGGFIGGDAMDVDVM